MPFNTRNPIPSGDLRDLDDNARNIDTWANDKTKLSHPDRFGVERYTWHGIEQKAQLDIAAGVADATAEAGQYRDQAIDAKNAAQEAAMMSGFSKYADTLAQLQSGIGTDYIEGDVVMVFEDESRGDTSSIYKVESGVAVFKNAFDKTRQDLLSFTGNISADAEWSDVPAHSDPAFDVQAQALANRTSYLSSKVDGVVTPLQMGAKGDGVADDTNALEAAIDAGGVLDFLDKTYRITRPITKTIAGAMKWRSSGAKIIFDPVSHSAHVIRLTLGVGAHYLDGILNIDAQNLAHVGFSVSSSTTNEALPLSDQPDIHLKDLRVSNVYRRNKSFGNGDGILVAGAFRNVILERPHATNCIQAVGADAIGSQGIAGISVVDRNRDNSSPQYVSIIDPYIDRVYSEDPLVDFDQDGIKVFSHYRQLHNTNDPIPSTFSIRGGVIKNSRNRAIKSQMQWGIIDGLTIIRDSSVDLNGSGKTRNPDIDLQVGGGTVTNLEVYYDGFVPNKIIEGVEPTSETFRRTTSLSVDGLKGVITNPSGKRPFCVVSSAAESAVALYKVNVSNIDIEGEVDYLIDVGASNFGGKARLNVSNAFAECVSGLLENNNSNARADVFLSNCHNTSSTLVPILVNTGQENPNLIVTASNCTGFIENPRATLGNGHQPFQRVNGVLAGTGAEPGSVRYITLTLTQNNPVTIPFRNSMGGSQGLMLVSSGNTLGTCGLLAISQNSVVNLTPESTGISVGTNVEPTEGNFRIWGSPDGPVLKSTSSTDRKFTIVLIG